LGLSYKTLPENLVAHVSPLSLQQHARATGWIRVQEIADLVVFRLPNDSDEIIVPPNATLADYSYRAAEIISAFAVHEKRSAAEVLNDLLLPAADILRLAMTTPGTENGTLHLTEGISLLSATKKALLSAAHDVLLPERVHGRLSRGEAETFINACRLGQTERGSFVATVVCPLTLVDSGQAELFSTAHNENFTRKVTAHFMKATNRIIEAISAGDLNRVVNPPDELLISANFCEALLDIHLPDERSAVTLSCTWSRSMPATLNIPPRVSVTSEYIPGIQEIAARLRPTAEPRRDTFIGKIDSLKGSDDEGEMKGEITLAFAGDDEFLKAKVQLGHNEYVAACDAHKESRYISVEGILNRGIRIHRITQPTNFRLVE
jgi:hypothetical protein